MGFLPRWLTRQCIAFSILVVMVIFLIISLSLPWYNIVETNVPYPASSIDLGYSNGTWPNQVATVAGLFYWNGYTQGFSPNSSATTTYHLSWGQMTSSSPKDIYMACMAMTILALIFSLGLGGLIVVGLIVPTSRRWADLVCCGKAKWIVFALSVIVLAFIFLAWIIFFGFPNALNGEGTTCPNPKYVGYNNKMWCETFVGQNYSIGHFNSSFTWGPSLGWMFSVFSMVCAMGVSFFLFIVKNAQNDHYEQVGGRDSYGRGGRSYDDDDYDRRDDYRSSSKSRRDDYDDRSYGSRRDDYRRSSSRDRDYRRQDY